MKNTFTCTSASLLAFIDYIHTQTWKPDTFFQFLYQWFTKEDGLLSDTECYLISASFLLEKSQKTDDKISDETVSLWNKLVLSTSRYKEQYTSLTYEDIIKTLDYIKNTLTQNSITTVPNHRLLSNYSVSGTEQ